MGRKKLTEEEKEEKRQREQAERDENNRQREIQNIIETVKKAGLPKSPRKVFFVNQEVVTPMSGHISGKVVEIISEGVYEVEYTYRTTKPHSKETHVLSGKRAFGWWDLFLPSEKECDLEYKEPLRLQFMQQSIDSLIHRFFAYWGLDMNPRYQREIVWTHDQKIELLDSIFSGLDIGKFVFINIPYGKGDYGYEILDGKQRLSTILEFYNDEWTYKGYYYSELSPMLKYKFEGLSVSVAEMRDDVATEKNILEYFIRLNKTGTPMDREHLQRVEKMLKD